MNAPIELVIYDEHDEPKQTYKRAIVPWGVMKKAMSLMKALDDLNNEKNSGQEQTRLGKLRSWFTRAKTDDPEVASLNMLEEFIVEFFGYQFKAADLKNADTGELMAVLQNIMARASNAMPANPTKPSRRS